MPLRIDAHHHVWDLGVRDQPWTMEYPLLHRTYGLEELRPALQAAGIDRTVLVQTVAVAEETPEFLGLASGAGADVIAGVVGWVDLVAGDVADRLAALRGARGGERLVGIRHPVQSEDDPRWLCRPEVRRGLAAVGARDLTYDLLVRPAQLPAAIETVQALPQMRFVVDHVGKPPIATGGMQPWRSHLCALAELPNVAVKLSGMVTEADWQGWRIDELRPFADIVLDAFGPSRVMYGSDWPVCLLAASYAETLDAAQQLTAALSDAERRDVFGGAAARWYRLPVTGAVTT